MPNIIYITNSRSIKPSIKIANNKNDTLNIIKTAQDQGNQWKVFTENAMPKGFWTKALAKFDNRADNA